MSVVIGEALVEQLAAEGLVPAVQAIRDATGRRVSAWTAIRLCRSSRLEALKVSGTWMSTVAAVRRMVAAETQAARSRSRSTPVPTRTPSPRRAREKAAAARVLESFGVKNR